MNFYDLRSRKLSKENRSSRTLRSSSTSHQSSSYSSKRRKVLTENSKSPNNTRCRSRSDKSSSSETSKRDDSTMELSEPCGSDTQTLPSVPDCVVVSRQTDDDENHARMLQASPDPVAQVRQFEEDERYAQMLQMNYGPVETVRQIEADEQYARLLQHSEVGLGHLFEQQNSDAHEENRHANDEHDSIPTETEYSPNESGDESEDFDEDASFDFPPHDGNLNVTRPLCESEISRLPVKIFEPRPVSSSSSGSGSSFDKECHVCMVNFQNGDLLRILPCFHEFHAPCIDIWLNRNNTCPICRVHITLEE